MYEHLIKQAYSRSWLLVFHHNYSKGKFPTTACNKSSEEGLFSSLFLLNQRYKINGFYEFLISYPKAGDIAWKQNVLPTEYTEKSIVDDDIGLHILMNKNNFIHFKGLMTSTANACFDGDNRSLEFYRYSIGHYGDQFDKIPGALVMQNGNETDINEDEVRLYIRVSSTNCTLRCSRNSLFSLYCFCFLCLSM